MKNHLHKKNLFTAILLLSVLSSCTYKDVEFIDIEDIEIKESSVKKIPITIKLKVDNPNTYKIKIQSYNIRLSIKQIDFIALDNDSKIIIPARFKGTIPIDISLKPELKGIFSLKTLLLINDIIKKNSVQVDAKGYIKAKVFLISKKIEVDEKRIIKLNSNK